jgi:hypothetical protein
MSEPVIVIHSHTEYSDILEINLHKDIEFVRARIPGKWLKNTMANCQMN